MKKDFIYLAQYVWPILAKTGKPVSQGAEKPKAEPVIAFSDSASRAFLPRISTIDWKPSAPRYAPPQSIVGKSKIPHRHNITPTVFGTRPRRFCYARLFMSGWMFFPDAYKSVGADWKRLFLRLARVGSGRP